MTWKNSWPDRRPRRTTDGGERERGEREEKREEKKMGKERGGREEEKGGEHEEDRKGNMWNNIRHTRILVFLEHLLIDDAEAIFH